MFRYVLWSWVAAVLLFGSACKGQCQQLAEKLCSCAGNTVDLNNCKTAVANEKGIVTITNQDELTCAKLLPGCDCHTINTTEGKQACGLARPPPPGGVVGG